MAVFPDFSFRPQEEAFGSWAFSRTFNDGVVAALSYSPRGTVKDFAYFVVGGRQSSTSAQPNARIVKIHGDRQKLLLDYVNLKCAGKQNSVVRTVFRHSRRSNVLAVSLQTSIIRTEPQPHGQLSIIQPYTLPSATALSRAATALSANLCGGTYSQLLSKTAKNAQSWVASSLGEVL